MSLWGKHTKLRAIVYFSVLYSLISIIDRVQISSFPIYPDRLDFLSDQFGFQSNNEECSSNPNGELVTRMKKIQIPDKNDGVINIHSGLWSENDNFDDLHNIYMKDVEINEKGLDEGGYNHFELRNYERAYKLEENGQVVFSIGDENESMKEAKEWLQQVLLNL